MVMNEIYTVLILLSLAHIYAISFSVFMLLNHRCLQVIEHHIQPDN